MLDLSARSMAAPKGLSTHERPGQAPAACPWEAVRPQAAAELTGGGPAPPHGHERGRTHSRDSPAAKPGGRQGARTRVGRIERTPRHSRRNCRSQRPPRTRVGPRRLPAPTARVRRPASGRARDGTNERRERGAPPRAAAPPGGGRERS